MSKNTLFCWHESYLTTRSQSNIKIMQTSASYEFPAIKFIKKSKFAIINFPIRNNETGGDSGRARQLSSRKIDALLTAAKKNLVF